MEKMMKADFIKSMGRWSQAKENLFDVYYNCFEKWMRRGIYRNELPFVPSIELRNASVRYFKHKHLFVLQDTNYTIGERCKLIKEWNPKFLECAMHLFNSGYQIPQHMQAVRVHKWKLDDCVSLSYSYTLSQKYFYDWVKGKIERDEPFIDSYVRKPNRLYTKGMSMQYIPSDMRNHFMPNHNDYDFQNCHWSIFYQTQEIGDEYKKVLKPMIEEPIDFMAHLHKHSGQPMKVLKQKRNAILYGDKRGTGCKELNNIKRYHTEWLSDKQKHASSLFSDITYWETKALEESVSECNVDLLMYDGFMTKDTIDICAIEKKIKDKIGINMKLVQKRAA